MKSLVVPFFLTIWCAATASAAFQITEFLASNQSGEADSSGAHPDWIEIHSDVEGSLEGYFLTDDPANLQRWALPAVTIPADGYLRVFASGDDLRDPAQDLHSNFSLAQSGGYLALVAPDEVTVITEFVDYPPQRTDVSYGYAGAALRFFKSPTPGAANPAQGIEGFVADTKFSIDRGFYDAPFDVTITTATEGAIIYYTTDGKVPGPGSLFTGPIGKIYDGPVAVQTTTTLRAVAYKAGFEPSNVDTQSYLFLKDVLRQTGEHLPQDWNGERADYAMDPRVVDHPDYKDTILEDFKTLPSLSIVLDPDDFFSTNKGIYPGKIGEDGIDKPCSAEFLNADGSGSGQIDCAVRIVGQTSPQRWKIKKLSMRLRFDKEYGPGELNYPVFEEADAVTTFNTLTLDARHNNTWAYQGGSEPVEQRRRAQYLRDQVAADLHMAMGGIGTHGRYMHLYVNGIYWGMYDAHERPDDAFQASYQGGKREDYDVLRHGTVVVSGSKTGYDDLHKLSRQDMAVLENYQAITQILDIDDFIQYMLVNVVLGNGDWGPKNYYVSRRVADPAGPWRYHSWDAEKVFQNLNDDLTNANDAGGPTGLHQNLKKSPEYRMRFADLLYKQTSKGGVMSAEGLRAHYKRRTDEIDRAIILESARWGDAANGVTKPYTRNDDWAVHRDWIMDTYFPQRGAIALAQLKKAGLTGDLDTPSLNQNGGYISATDQVVLSKSVFASGNIVYTTDGSDPRAVGGTLSETAIDYVEPLKFSESTTVKTRLFKSSLFGVNSWSPLVEAHFVVDAFAPEVGSLVVNKVNFHPAAVSAEEASAGYSATDFEFIQLLNVSAKRLDLRSVKIDQGIAFDFANATIQELAPGEGLYLVEDLEAFAMRFGTGLPVAGKYAGNLSNGGETLSLQGPTGTLLTFAFNDNADWPATADGGGAYLVLVNPSSSSDLSDPAAWAASSESLSGGNGGDGAAAYDAWVTTAFPTDSPAALTAPSADPDGDHFANLLEYTLGSDPNKADSMPMMVVRAEGDEIVLLLSRRMGLPVGKVRFEVSNELTSWKALQLEERGGSATANPDIEVKRFALAGGRYLRVLVDL